MLRDRANRFWKHVRSSTQIMRSPAHTGSSLERVAPRIGVSSHADIRELDVRLKLLIADQENANLQAGALPVRPEDITVEYILGERRRRIYPKIHYKIHSPYGGYSHVGVRSISLQELEAISREVETRMAHF